MNIAVRAAYMALMPLLIVAAGCNKNTNDATPPPGFEMVFPVTVGTVSKGTIESKAAVVGVVRWPRTVVIKSEIAGRVVDVQTREGDTCDSGTLLVKVAPGDYQLHYQQRVAELERAKRELARLHTGTRPEFIASREAVLAQMKARVALAQDAHNRTKALVEQKVRPASELIRATAALAEANAQLAEATSELRAAINGPTQDEIRIAEADVAIAEQRVQSAQRDVEKCRIVAPFSGITLQRLVEPGAYVTVGTALVELASPAETEAIVELPEHHAAHIQQIGTFNVVADALPSQTFKSTVAAVIPQADSASRNFRLRVAIDNPNAVLMPGMFLRGTVPLVRRDDVLLVNQDAVTLKSGDTFVYVVSDQHVQPVPVTIGLTDGSRTEVIGDLQPGALVVTTGAEVLFPGAKVLDTANAQHGMAPTPPEPSNDSDVDSPNH